MHDRLRMHDDVNLIKGRAEQCMGFNDFKALIHERLTVDGDLWPH
jgi:hypothetical protein